MARRSIPADAFFKRSPKISVPQGDARSPTFREAFMWTELNGHLGVPVDCFLRTKSDEERDAHLARLKGILKMYAFLTKLEREGVEYRVYYNNRVCLFDLSHDVAHITKKKTFAAREGMETAVDERPSMRHAFQP
jgi:hypothetical protein